MKIKSNNILRQRTEGEDGTFERRLHKRFKLKNDAIVIVQSKKEQLYGFLMDISTGGISFEYIPPDKTFDDAFMADNKLDILLEGTNRYCKSLPFRIISDFKIVEQYYSPVTMRRECVQFVGLTTEQLSNLRHFIQENVRE